MHRETPEHEDCVLCHAPHPTRFGSRKSDHWGAIGCCRCHDYVDSRADSRLAMTKVLLSDIWLPAIKEWQDMLMEADLMRVEGIEPIKKQLPRR